MTAVVFVHSIGRARRQATLASAALCLAGCNLEWKKPEVGIPPPAHFRESKPVSARPIPRGIDFAAKFGSKKMTKLVEQATRDNFDVAAAVARIRQADAQARVSSSVLWPNISMQDAARTFRIPGTTINIGNAATGFSPATIRSSSSVSSSKFNAHSFGFFQLGLAASYMMDFWGRYEDTSYAARLLANASRFNRDTVEITTIVAVINTYFQILAAQDRIRIAENYVAIADRVNRAIQARFQAGIATMLDTAQQESVLGQARASIPPLKQTLRQTKNQLAVLIGQTPESIDVRNGSLTKLSFPRISPGLPSEVLLRRPDVADAEAQLASQAFSVLASRAAFFPSITLTGQHGVQSALLRNLIRPEAIGWQMGMSLTQPIFDGFNLQGQYEQQKGRYAELAVIYRKRILTALSDTENAIIAVRETERALRLRIVAAVAAQKALTAAERRLEEGTIDIITLSTTQTTLFQAQDQVALSRLAYFQAATSLYQALGGGWSPTTRDVEIANANAAYEADKGPFP